MGQTAYCIDTSSLIHIHQEYPEDVFASLWEHLAGLVHAGRLFAPHEVLKEIEKGDDELCKWVKKQRRMFRHLDAEQIQMVAQIAADFPKLVDWQKETPEADPFVIALAQVQEDHNKTELFPTQHIVITQESATKPNKIPAVCKHYGIECINILEFFRMEGWKF